MNATTNKLLSHNEIVTYDNFSQSIIKSKENAINWILSFLGYSFYLRTLQVK